MINRDQVFGMSVVVNGICKKWVHDMEEEATPNTVNTVGVLGKVVILVRSENVSNCGARETSCRWLFDSPRDDKSATGGMGEKKWIKKARLV